MFDILIIKKSSFCKFPQMFPGSLHVFFSHILALINLIINTHSCYFELCTSKQTLIGLCLTNQLCLQESIRGIQQSEP